MKQVTWEELHDMGTVRLTKDEVSIDMLRWLKLAELLDPFTAILLVGELDEDVIEQQNITSVTKLAEQLEKRFKHISVRDLVHFLVMKQCI